MIIYLKKNIRLDVTLPIGPVRCFTSSALLVELAEIPEALGDGKVSAVTVTVVNADGMPVTSAQGHPAGEAITAQLADGELSLTVRS